jgi:heme o synthase
LILLASGGFWIPLFLGAGNIVCYNAVYTPLKMKSTFALIPGAVTGAVPVLMGWSSAGCTLLSAQPLFLGIFMFFWQVPHFWLLSLTYDEEYRKAGIPTMTMHFSYFQIKRLILVWLAAASVTSLMMVSSGFPHHPIPALIILTVNIFLFMVTVYRFFILKSGSFRILFVLVNCFLLVVLLLLIIDKLFLTG